MNQKAKRLYQQLQQDIAHCKQKVLDCQTKCECCFGMSENYWKLVKDEVSGFSFDNLTDEIEFFKGIKPLFTSEIEYYRLILSTTHFRPGESEIQELKVYWKRQVNRLRRFISYNGNFYQYYKNGQTSKDEEWFVRDNNDFRNFINSPPYDTDNSVATSHDYLVAKLMALERYAIYAENKFKEIAGSRE